MHVIGVFNRDGGTFKTTDMDAFAARAVEIFAAAGHELEARIVEGKQLLKELERAAGDAEILLAGGGDGTISAAAATAYRQGVPLAVVPAGTMNLFARSLQMPLDLEGALEAIAGGEIRDIDIATANGRPFIHQFSVGIHAKLVKLRESLTYKSRLGKMMASTRAAAGALLRAPNFHVDVATRRGVERRATAGIAVSNNPLEGALPRAERLDAGVLGIYIIAPLTPCVVTKLSFGVLRGQWKALPEIIDREAREVTIRFPRKKSNAVAVIDGELVKLADKVELRIHPGALRVVMPRAAIEAAEAEADIVVTPA
ncbi:MAG: diacylglycerol kinase family lipid kinase [Hyphomicrobiales bacterium]|nr:MAG: diacylglycerol kinase family lipid kinase [Hyphomicrobiales bacterium]